jgi:uncharacterized FAD-dependent dehydrogenase
MNWYIFRSVAVKLGKAVPDYRQEIAKMTGLKKEVILETHLARKSLDARKKHRPHWLHQIEFKTGTPIALPLPKGVFPVKNMVHAPEVPLFLERKPEHSKKTALVIGAGPAGLFAALALAGAGVRTTLVERGKPVETRMKDIGTLRGRGVLNPESNVCFGEGGAGTYTDGKLYTRVKNSVLPWVMAQFVELGGPEEIMTDAHPHLGTDKLVRIIKNMRTRLEELGVRVLFEKRMEELIIHHGRAAGVVLNSGEQIEADYTVLGIGHSARETLEYLHGLGLSMSFKPFAAGVRVEHPQELINRSQYGSYADHPELGAAEYRLSYQHPDDHLKQRGVYSFCMCPGGLIVPTPTQQGRMALNGMSNANRSTPFANSGIVVQITRKDLEMQGYDNHPLMGIRFQQDLERSTFLATKTPFAAPAMRITDFVSGKEPKDLAPTHFRPGAEPFPLNEILPLWMYEPMKAALTSFAGRIKGYLTEESNLFAVESRTSSPVRIERDDNLESVSLPGLFPVGEGAGYAGGIVSAAIDGLKAAERIIGFTTP